MSGWKPRIKTKRWFLAMEVPKRILTKRKPSQIQRNRTGSRKQKKNARNETHANSGAKVECFVCKEIKCELTMVLGGETGFVLSVPQTTHNYMQS